jgi:hypothetical protein
MLGIIALLLSLYLNCSKIQESRENVVATVEERSIDWRMIRRSYHLEPKWGRGLTHREAYQNQLDFLIEQKLFALEATANGLDEDKSIAGLLEAVKEKEMIKELYRQEVASRVNISDEEYRTAYLRSKKQVKFEFIYTPDINRALIYLAQLKTTPVEDIQLVSPLTEQKGISPMFSYGDITSELEEVVFDMQLNEVKGPIEIDEKYMIVKVVDGEVDKFMSETDFAENKSKIQKVIFDRRARKISDEYIYKILNDQEVKVNSQTFHALAKQFSEIVKSKNSDSPFPIYVSNSELKATETNLKDMAGEVLVTFKDGQFTIEEFLNKLWNMPGGMRPQVNMAPQLKKAIAVTVRNHYLARQAYQQGLDKSPQVLYEVEAESDQLLARYYLRKIRGKITVTPEEVEEFKHKENFAAVYKRLNGKLDDAAIRNIILDYKLGRQRIETADSLGAIYTVSIDSALVEAHIPKPDEIIREKPAGFAYRDRFY